MITADPPGKVLEERFLNHYGLTKAELARQIHVPAGRIVEIIKGRRVISVDTAYRLGRFFGTGPEFWLYVQMKYDMSLYESEWQDLSVTITPYIELPE